MARPGLTGHRKFRRLARALGSPLVARGALELLWESCYECGDDYVGTAEDVEAAVGWTGEPGALTRALEEAGAPEGAGFIEAVESGAARYRIHDLWHHAPDYVKKRKEREMDRQRRTAPNGGQRPPTSDCLPGVDLPPSPAPSPTPAPSPEDKSGSPEAVAGSGPFDEPVLTFPAVGKGGPEWRLRRRQVDEWVELYPGLDVLAECRKALAWLNANPGRRKTTRGMPSFLANWLNRATDRGGGPRSVMGSKSAGNVASLSRFVQGGTR